jgi:hypothetical protein
MSTRHKNYLRGCRKRLGITQTQASFLIGQNTRARLSALENGAALPALHESIIFEKIYEKRFAELWPDVYQRIVRDLSTRVGLLLAQCDDAKPQAYRKRQRAAFVQRRLKQLAGRATET